MTNVRKIFPKALSMLVSLMIVLTGFVPAASVLATAEQAIVTETATQKIESFGVYFVSGASNNGTPEEPEWVWTVESEEDRKSGHIFKYQLDYAFSGEGELVPGSVSMTFPKHILRERNGAYADELEVAVPEESEVPPDDIDNQFVFTEREDDILVYNRLSLSAAEKGSIQFGYATTKGSFDYADMHSSDRVSIELFINKTADEHLYTMAEGEPVRINTAADINSFSKSFHRAYQTWQDNWGDPESFGIDNQDDYYYLAWLVRMDISATQPYILSFDDEVEGQYGDASFVCMTTFYQNGYTNVMQSEELRTYGKYLDGFVITKHLKSTYRDMVTYRIFNTLQATLHPVDSVDDDVVVTSKARYTYSQPTITYPVGNFDFWKYNNYSYYHNYKKYNSEVINYELSEFRNGQIDAIQDKMVYLLEMEGNPYPWTIGRGYSKEDVSHYGEEKVTYVMTDDAFFFADTITAVQDKETYERIYEIPQGTEQLDYHDFEITSVDYKLEVSGAQWNEETLRFEKCHAEYDDDDVIRFYAKFGADSTWYEAGRYYLKSGVGETLSDKVSSITDKGITFTDNAQCVGYQIVISNSFYRTNLQAYPFCKIKHSDRIDSLIEESYAAGERRVWLTNIGRAKFYNCNSFEEIADRDPIFEKTDFCRNYIIGYEKKSDLKKESTFISNDKVKHIITIGWKAEAYESYMTQQGEVFVPQETGVFYDLVPYGAEPDLSSVAVWSDAGLLKESELDIETIVNYRDSGRTLLIVRMKKRSNAGYTLTYSSVHPWESIFDYGSMVRNSVAYETGNDYITDGFADNGGNILDSELLSELDDTTDAEKFLYAEHTRSTDVLLAVNSGLNKKIKTDTDDNYSRSTVVRQSQDYVYRLRYQTDYVTRSKNMVLFDNIEAFTNPAKGIQSRWHGTLQSVDVSQIREAGAEPVIYLSDHAVDTTGGVFDLSDSSTWKKAEDFGDITKARAIAIDLSKDQNGEDFVLDNNKSISALLYMKAPATEPDEELPPDEPVAAAYNDVAVSTRLLSVFSETYYNDRYIQWNYDKAELRIQGDVPLLKLDDTDHTTPVEGIAFRLQGVSAYGTEVDTVLETDVNGKLVFRDIEKGSYELTEYKGSSDYLKFRDILSVTIREDGTTEVNGTTVDKGVYYQVYDTPRVHTDITFDKRDLRQKSKSVEGVQFRLSGVSFYGSAINRYAFSDEWGVVTFEDIEMGTYLLKEVSTAEGYILSDSEYRVIIDENGHYEIEGAQRERDGSYVVFNESYHSFTIQKEGYIEAGGSPLPVAGAKFNLSGISDNGTVVDMNKTTGINGQATFDHLESGRYVLFETEAPEGYLLNTERYIVTITGSGDITVSGSYKNASGYFVIKNKEDSNVVITKKWVDRKTNRTRTADPVIYLGIEDNEPAAYFNGRNEWSVLNDVVSPNYSLGGIKRFKHYTGDSESAQTMMDRFNAVRIDDGTTDRHIYGWYMNEAGDEFGTLYWWSDAPNVYMTNQSRHLWYNLTGCTEIDTTGINTSLVTDMSEMFNNCRSVTSLDLTGFDSSNVKNMSGMFNTCSALRSIDLSGLDTSKVKDMSGMFYECGSLQRLDLTSFDTSNVRDMSYMFSACTVLESVDVSSFDTSKVTTMEGMFESVQGLETVDLSNFDTSNVTTMEGMFYYCGGLKHLDMSMLDTSNVTNMRYLLLYDYSLESVNLLGLETGNVTTMQYMFYYCGMLTELDLSSFDTAKVTDMSMMFDACSSLESLNVSNFDTSSVTTMFAMFRGCRGLRELDLSSFHTPKLTAMGSMFYGCSRLKTVDLSGFDTSHVTGLGSVFESCGVTTLDLSSFDTSNVVSMNGMFDSCRSLTKIYASSLWNTDNVVSANNMFADCHSLNTDGLAARYNGSNNDLEYARIHTAETPGYLRQGTEPQPPAPEIKEAYFKSAGTVSDLSMVTDPSNVKAFRPFTGNGQTITALIDSGAAVRLDDESTDQKIYAWYINDAAAEDFGTVYWWSDADEVYLRDNSHYLWSGLSECAVIDVSGINTSKLTNMSGMFNGCYKVQTLDLSSFDTSNVTSMSSMFKGCHEMTSVDLSSFDTSKTTSMDGMFRQCFKLTELDLSNFDTSKVTSMKEMFCHCDSLQELNISSFDTYSVTNMNGMFVGCSDLSVLDVGNFDTSNVTDMSLMFNDCSGAEQLDVSRFDTSKVTNMSGMFNGCSKLTSLDVGGFDTSNVTDMSEMFRRCSRLETLDLSNWQTEGANLGAMFEYCVALHTIYAASKWSNTPSLNDSENKMFAYCTSLVGGNGTVCDSNHTGADYALIDEESQTGYLTYKAERIKELKDSNDPTCMMEKVNDTTWTYTFTELDPNITYYAWESELQDYSSLNMGKKNCLVVENGQGTITNTAVEDPPAFGSLTVKKNVVLKDYSQSISDSDKARKFRFTVTLKDGEGAALTEDLLLNTRKPDGSEGSILFTAGKAGFVLSDDEELTVKDIPEGYQYTVAETPEEGFEPTVSGDAAEGVIEADTTKDVLFTNRKNYDDSEDITFTVSKALRGTGLDPDERFAFVADFTGLRAGTAYAVKVGGEVRKSFTAGTSGNAFVEFELKDQETASITIPENASYVITERAGNYTSSYRITDVAGLNRIVRSNDSNTDENTALSTQTETADSGEQIAIVFTNTKNVKQKLTLTKEVVNATAGNSDLFEFTVRFKGLPARAVIPTTIGRMTADEAGTLTAEFSLLAGRSVEFDELPVGAVYEIIEAGSDYVASCIVQNGEDIILQKENNTPQEEMTTGEQSIELYQDAAVTFTNRKVSCDITVTKLVDMTYGNLTTAEYSKHEFKFDIRVTGLQSSGKKYSELKGEFTAKDTTGSRQKSLAELMDLSGAAAEAIADRAEFTVTLHHGESFKLKGLPYGAAYFVTEQANTAYVVSYTVSSNEGAVLQTTAAGNTVRNKSLRLNAEEMVDTNDTDIEFVFNNQYEFIPYVLPAAGMNDMTALYASVLCCMLLCAAVYVISAKEKSIKQ